MPHASLNQLPYELLYIILMQLNLKELATTSLISRKFYTISTDNMLWKHFLKQAFKNLEDLPEGQVWKSFPYNHTIKNTSLVSKFFKLLEHPIQAKLIFSDQTFYDNAKQLLKEHYPSDNINPAGRIGEGLLFILKTFPFAVNAICTDYRLYKQTEHLFDTVIAQNIHYASTVHIGLTEAAIDHENLATPILSAFTKFFLNNNVAFIDSEASYYDLKRSPAYRLTKIAIYHENAAHFILSTPELYQVILHDEQSASYLSQIAQHYPTIAKKTILKEPIFYNVIINSQYASIELANIAAKNANLAINVVLLNPIFFEIISSDHEAKQYLNTIRKAHKLDIPLLELTPDKLRTALLQKQIENLSLVQPYNPIAYWTNKIKANIEKRVRNQLNN